MAEADRTEMEERLQLHEKGDSLDVLMGYYSTVSRIVMKCGNIRKYNCEFAECKTDFERVCLLLKLFQNTFSTEEKREMEVEEEDDDDEEDDADVVEDKDVESKGIEVLSLPTQLSELVSNTGKDDEISKLCLEKAREYQTETDMRNALKFFTYSLFYAESRNRKGEAFFERGHLFQGLNYFEAALDDLTNADKAYESQNANVQKGLAETYLKMKKYNDALRHFRNVKKILGNTDETVLKNITICKQNKNLKMPKPTENWCSYHPEPPESLNSLPKTNVKPEIQTTDHLLHFKNGPLKFKNSNSERGWILEAKRDISVGKNKDNLTFSRLLGEVILVEKPYATVLNNPRTANCYYCHKRCLSLQPCGKCPYVGFCNATCEKYAKEEGRGPGSHTYECHGILPYLLIDRISSRPESDLSYTGCAITCHLAYRCIANTPQEKLIDYITRSGCYKGNGRGHQAFETSSVVRAAPLPVKFASSDYSSVAWLDPCTEKRNYSELWQKTMAAVFLTYCLSLSGYAMSWYEDGFYSVPESDHRPEIIPASWVAACILYHLQALTINCQNNTLISSPTSKIADGVMESIATSVYSTYSLFNHSCNPNAVLINTARGGIFVFALHPIPQDSEVTVSYICTCYSYPALARRMALKYKYLFDCKCEACRDLWYEESLSKFAIIKCPECSNLFSITDGVCGLCKSNKAFKQYKTLATRINLLLKANSPQICWPEEVAKGTEAWNTIQGLLQPKGMVFTPIRTDYLNLILHRCGIFAIEPFQKRPYMI